VTLGWPNMYLAYTQDNLQIKRKCRLKKKAIIYLWINWRCTSDLLNKHRDLSYRNRLLRWFRIFMWRIDRNHRLRDTIRGLRVIYLSQWGSWRQLSDWVRRWQKCSCNRMYRKTMWRRHIVYFRIQLWWRCLWGRSRFIKWLF